MKYRVIRPGMFLRDGKGKVYEAEVGSDVELTTKQAEYRSGKIEFVTEEVKDSEDRIETIVLGIEALEPEDFNKDGITPSMKALEALLEFDVTSEERDTAMKIIANGIAEEEGE